MLGSNLFVFRHLWLNIACVALLASNPACGADAAQKNISKQSASNAAVKTETAAKNPKAQNIEGTLVVHLSAEGSGSVQIESLTLDKSVLNSKNASAEKNLKEFKAVLKSTKPEQKWVELKKISSSKKAAAIQKAAINKKVTTKKVVTAEEAASSKKVAAAKKAIPSKKLVVALKNNTTKQEQKKKEFTAPSQPKIINARVASDVVAAVNPTENPGANNIIKTAYNYLKTAYRMGGTSPRGFDCSGFTRFIFGKHGVELPRSSVEQAKKGAPIEKDQLQTGDLVFFSTFRRGISHVGIFIANGIFIHASGYGKGVSLDNISSKYWGQRYRTARRVDLSGARQYAMLEDEKASSAG